MDSDKRVLVLIEEALSILDKTLSEVLSSPEEDYMAGKLGRAIGMLREFQHPVYERNPQLRSRPPWHGLEEPELKEEQKIAISKISNAELELIDSALLSHVTDRYQKVAKIVLTHMFKNDSLISGIPDIFYVQRIERLALLGDIEYEGNLKFAQFCEVRIAKT